MIVLFLCTNLTPPAVVPMPQTCPASPASPASATVTGSLIAADVIARPDQGIEGGAAGFAEIVKALRAGAAYAVGFMAVQAVQVCATKAPNRYV